MSKQCRSCGADLPDEASFCPYCTGSQIDKENIVMPVPKRKKLLALGVLLLVIIAAAFVVWYQLKPKTYDNGGADIIYKNGETSWHILLRNSINDDFHWKTPQEKFSRMCTKGTTGAIPLQLYVYDEETGENASDEFMQLVESNKVTSSPRNGADPMECSVPAVNPGFVLAPLASDVLFTTDCGTNDISWTITLKNRDTVILHEVAEIQVNPEISYSWETTPLDTAEKLQALLEQIKAEVEDPNTVVNITLAPVEYTGDINITERAVNLTGSSDEKGATVIKGCLSVDNRNPLFVTLTDIAFEGPGTGIYATEGVVVNSCDFRGKDTGFYAADGSWPVLWQCDFENCGIGLHFNSSSSTMKNALFDDLSFKGNDTAVWLERIPGTDVLYFTECVFENNGTDIENQTPNEISYTLDMGT